MIPVVAYTLILSILKDVLEKKEPDVTTTGKLCEKLSSLGALIQKEVFIGLNQGSEFVIKCIAELSIVMFDQIL